MYISITSGAFTVRPPWGWLHAADPDHCRPRLTDTQQYLYLLWHFNLGAFTVRPPLHMTNLDPDHMALGWIYWRPHPTWDHPTDIQPQQYFYLPCIFYFRSIPSSSTTEPTARGRHWPQNEWFTIVRNVHGPVWRTALCWTIKGRMIVSTNIILYFYYTDTLRWNMWGVIVSTDIILIHLV